MFYRLVNRCRSEARPAHGSSWLPLACPSWLLFTCPSVPEGSHCPSWRLTMGKPQEGALPGQHSGKQPDSFLPVLTSLLRSTAEGLFQVTHPLQMVQSTLGVSSYCFKWHTPKEELEPKWSHFFHGHSLTKAISWPDLFQLLDFHHCKKKRRGGWSPAFCVNLQPYGWARKRQWYILK